MAKLWELHGMLLQSRVVGVTGKVGNDCCLAASLDLRLEVAAQVKPARLSFVRFEDEIGLGPISAGNPFEVVD